MEKQDTKQAADRSAIQAFEEFRDLLRLRQQELEAQLPRMNKVAELAGLGSLSPYYGGLLGKPIATPPASSPISVDALSPVLKKHEAYRRLIRSENYVRALRIFRARRAPQPDPTSVAIAELQFMEQVLSWVGFSMHVTSTGWRPKSVGVHQKRRALSHARQLLADMKGGVALHDATSSTLLQRMLTTLCHELQAPAKRDYAGHGRERKILTALALSLLASGRLPRDAVVDVVGECGQLYGFNVSQRSIQRYVQAARRQVTELLADALQRQKT